MCSSTDRNDEDEDDVDHDRDHDDPTHQTSRWSAHPPARRAALNNPRHLLLELERMTTAHNDSILTNRPTDVRPSVRPSFSLQYVPSARACQTKRRESKQAAACLEFAATIYATIYATHHAPRTTRYRRTHSTLARESNGER